MTLEEFPLDKFFCLLDEQPDHLVPLRLLRQRKGHGTLMINPSCWFGWQGPPPSKFVDRLSKTEGLFNHPWVVWVDDPATGVLAPFWLGPEFAHVLVDMVPGQRLHSRLANELLDILWNAEVVVASGHRARRRDEWAVQLRCLHGDFQHGHVILEHLIHPFQIGALRRYFRHQIRTAKLTLRDGKFVQQNVSYRDPVADFFHRQLTQIVSDVVGASVVPTYSCVTVYPDDAHLPANSSRKKDDYTLTFCFDSTPEAQAQLRWPLVLTVGGGSLTIGQYLGEGLLLGDRYTSGRHTAAIGQDFACLLLHYTRREPEAAGRRLPN